MECSHSLRAKPNVFKSLNKRLQMQREWHLTHSKSALDFSRNRIFMEFLMYFPVNDKDIFANGVKYLGIDMLIDALLIILILHLNIM